MAFDPVNNQDRFLRSLGTKLAGERNETKSDGTDYVSVVNEATYTVVAAATIAADTTTTISAVPAVLLGYHITTIPETATCAFDDDTTEIVVIPLTNTTAGQTASLVHSTVMFNPGIRFETSLKLDPQASSTGAFVVYWREL